MEQQDETIKIKLLASSIATKNIIKKQKNSRQFKRKNDQKQNNQLLDNDIEIPDLLKTLSHQKKPLTANRWKSLKAIHQNMIVEQQDFKYFIMIATQANFVMLEHVGYYSSLKQKIKDYPSSFFNCIDKDVPRTLANNHPFFDPLRNVLCCYAIRNPSVHYCQGMNYLVAFFLINNFNEQQAYWLLVQLIQTILMPDYFKNLSIVSITTQIFTDIFQSIYPNFTSQIEDLGMDASMFSVSWYVCLFSKGFINSVSQHLFEYIILESRQFPIGFILLKISIAVITAVLQNQQPFEFYKDYAALKDTFQKKCNQISLQQIKYSLTNFTFNLDKYLKLQEYYAFKRQQNYFNQIQQQLKQSNLFLPPCSQSNPICMHRIQIQKKVGEIQEVLILKTENSIKQLIDKQYFPKNVSRLSVIPHFKGFPECLVAHHRHICNYKQDIHANILPNMSFNTQKSTYFPINNIDNEQGYQQYQGQFFSRFSNVQDIYSRFSNYFIIQQESQVKRLQKASQNVETSIQDIMCREHRYARVMLDSEEDNGFGQFIQTSQQTSLQGSKEDISKKNIFSGSVSYAIKKAVQGINLLKSKNTRSSIKTRQLS